ncbi:MAG: hypothetical protein L3K01_09505 [Thermoplasmata archaeon]|nr:hypothetical protein [Thermoplasmata archaeon]MCI4333934.1 hypothetical protein [Thermoplasmata archaeon]
MVELAGSDGWGSGPDECDGEAVGPGEMIPTLGRRGDRLGRAFDAGLRSGGLRGSRLDRMREVLAGRDDYFDDGFPGLHDEICRGDDYADRVLPHRSGVVDECRSGGRLRGFGSGRLVAFRG